MGKEYGFIKVQIHDQATFKTKKEIWRLKTAQSFLRNLLSELKAPPNKDIGDVNLCIQILGRVIDNQVHK